MAEIAYIPPVIPVKGEDEKFILSVSTPELQLLYAALAYYSVDNPKCIPVIDAIVTEYFKHKR